MKDHTKPSALEALLEAEQFTDRPRASPMEVTMPTDHERDAAVAEKVLGLGERRGETFYASEPIPDFTDPRADYRVLECVRKWPREHIIDFALHLHEMWAQRRPIYGEGWVHYRPSDFADAALAEVREREGSTR